MAIVTRLILDVLKAHQPNALDFASQLADLGDNYHVNLVVQEVDDKTSELRAEIEKLSIEFNEESFFKLAEMAGITGLELPEKMETINIKETMKSKNKSHAVSKLKIKIPEASIPFTKSFR